VDAEGPAAAMVGDAVVATKYGTEKSGDYIRGLAQLEAQRARPLCQLRHEGHRRRLGRALGATSRAPGKMLAAVVTAALAEAALPEEMANQIKVAIARQIRQIGVA
jgi:hypothetical protein